MNNRLAKLRSELQLKLKKEAENAVKQDVRDRYVDVGNGIYVGGEEAFSDRKVGNNETLIVFTPLKECSNAIDALYLDRFKSYKTENFGSGIIAKNNNGNKAFIIDNIEDEWFNQASLPPDVKQNNNPDKFIKSFKDILRNIDLSKTCYINCSAGLSRSVLFSACLKALKEGVERGNAEITQDSLMDSIKSVQKARYSQGYYDSVQILSHSGLTKSIVPVDAEALVLEPHRLIEMAKDNKFDFRAKLTTAINDMIQERANANTEITTTPQHASASFIL